MEQDLKHSKMSNGQYPAVLISHPTGNQNVRNAVRSLAEHGMLAEFWTTIAWDRESALNQLLPSRIAAQLARRSFDGIAPGRIHVEPWREVVRLLPKPAWLAERLSSGEQPFSVIGVYRAFDGRVARRLNRLEVDAVYAYEGGALQSFRAAKRLGIKTIYELPSSYWYWNLKVLGEEAERNPAYANLVQILSDSKRHLTSKDEELELADHVIVPSGHVKATLAGIVPESRITVIPYGAPSVRERPVGFSASGSPLRVLFVGGLHQRKGIGYVIDAIESLDFAVDFTLVGRPTASNPLVEAACRKWRWFESLPHSEVLQLMQAADVLVLPSLSEGCALVVLEALSCGLPVIVTPNAGVADFVRDGFEGFIVPVCDAGAIADKLRRLNNDRPLLSQMSAHAQQAARAMSWDNYRAQLSEAVRSVACQS
jgi:glycosyltransferase involved in cell wall biosynthesis